MVVPPSTGTSSATAARPGLTPAPSSSTPAKSKVSNGVAAPGTVAGPPSGNNHAIPLSARRAEPLDLKTVERRGQPNEASEVTKKTRLFGIPEAPTYRPTEEEFKDPMEYMRKIAPEGRKYGIIKVIPPDNWNPKFAINTERFHFRTRRQELNSVEGGSRVNQNYLDQLARFHKQNGHNLNRFPSVDKRPLDLYRLKKTVDRKGGFEKVCKAKRWAEVGRDLGYSGKIMSSLSTSLKNSYQKWLLPYEEYLRVAKPSVHQQLELENGGPFTPSPGPSPMKKSHTNTPSGLNEDTPAMRASAVFNASINSQGTPERHSIAQDVPAPPSAGGFTPVNAGGFTAVNAGGFQPVNAPTPTSSFTSVNGLNGFHHDIQSTNGTPHRSIETPPSSIHNAPSFLPPHLAGFNNPLKRQLSESNEEGLTPEEKMNIERRSKRLKRDVPTVAGSNMHHSRMSTPKLQPPRDRSNAKPGEVCETCGKSEDMKSVLLCENCDCGYHMYCLEPPLKSKPDYDWHCPRCLVGTGEYGFEEGDVYSLQGFQKRANDFKQLHFDNLPAHLSPLKDGKRYPNEEDVEREYWRLVEDLTDTVEVEYGADIHSTTHGSGFPTIEKQPRDPCSADPWNLNILPLDKESLFRHIKTDISGMTVPWLYVGMIFSTFCWHNEDHYSYSANYQHFGETKTWYGIPGEDAGKFEDAMREEVPELFETQPDLLFQLVTLSKPEKLKKAGVRVYAIDQRAGQFVITFPQAYHAGFNHGFNFNEAVNFAPHDWEPFGELGVSRLRQYRKQPCFSHDELLLTAASTRDLTIKTAKWLGPALQRMEEHELAVRKHFLGTLSTSDAENVSLPQDSYFGPRYAAEPEINTEDLEEDDYVCSYCKAFSYLSRYVCRRSSKVMCLLHAGGFECCDATEESRHASHHGEHVLYYRLTDEALMATVRKVVDKANVPEVWMEKVDKELEDNPTPSLKHMRTLLTEGEKIQYDLPQLPDLRKFVERCNEWVEEATGFITRKQQNRRKNEKAWRKGTAKAAEMEERDKELRKVENIHRLLASADAISFDCPEINTLRERAESIKEFQQDAAQALSNITTRTAQDFEELVELGKSFHVDIPEVEQLERLVKRLRWNEMARDKRPPINGRQTQTLKDITDFIQQGLDMGVPEVNSDIVFFREHKQQGELWEQKAKELMAVEQVHYQQLDALSAQAATLPVTPDTLAQVDAILKKQREAQEKIVHLYEMSKDPDFRKRPMYKEVRDVMAALEELNSKPAGTIDLEKEQRRHEDWMRRGKKLFGKANAPLHILHQHMLIVENRNESCFDLNDKPRMPVEPSSREHTPEEPTQGVTDGSNSSRDVFCICRKPEAGMMIECELCHEWYHGKCLKIARGKVKEDDKYTCPICDWRVKIPRDAARPKLEDLQAWQEELEGLPFQPEEEHTLNNIVEHAASFRDFMRPYVNPVMASPEEVTTLRFHLRKIEGADILLAYETNYLRQELHKWAPVAPDPPPVLEQSLSTRKPRPTKQQKLMAQLGITNPDDLPQQYKIKPHVAKRKQSEAHAKIPANLQPAHAHGSSPSVGTPTSQSASASGYGPPPSGQQPGQTPVPTTTMGQHQHTPSFSYDMSNHHTMVTQAYRDTSLFAPSAFTGHSQTNQTASQPPRLASPARLTPPSNSFVKNSPEFGVASLDTSFFGGAGNGPSIFDSPAKPTATSPGFNGTTQAGINSPAFGGSQHSVGNNLDSMFADIIHDHETAESGQGADSAEPQSEHRASLGFDDLVNHS